MNLSLPIRGFRIWNRRRWRNVETYGAKVSLGRRLTEIPMTAEYGSRCIESWSHQSREAATLVVAQYGKPDKVTEAQLTWHNAELWKRIVASLAYSRGPN